MIEVIGETPEEADRFTKLYLKEVQQDFPAEGKALTQAYLGATSSSTSASKKPLKSARRPTKASDKDFTEFTKAYVENVNKNVLNEEPTN